MFVYVETALHSAAKNGNVDAILALLSKGGSHLEALAEYDWTPLHWAAKNDKEKAIEVLAGCGANIEARSSNGETPLHIASSFNSLSAMRALIAAGASWMWRMKMATRHWIVLRDITLLVMKDLRPYWQKAHAHSVQNSRIRELQYPV